MYFNNVGPNEKTREISMTSSVLIISCWKMDDETFDSKRPLSIIFLQMKWKCTILVFINDLQFLAQMHFRSCEKRISSFSILREKNGNVIF